MVDVDAPSRSDYLADLFAEGRRTGIIVSPLNYQTYHWCCVIINFEEKKLIMFDSLQSRLTYAFMAQTVRTLYAPFMRDVYANLTEEHFRSFRQTDGWNCGVYVLEFVNNYINNTLVSFERAADNDLEHKRTQLLRLQYFSTIIKACTLPLDSKKRRRGSRSKKSNAEIVLRQEGVGQGDENLKGETKW